MEEYTARIPWDCGGKDGCETRWHTALYDYDAETRQYFVSPYGDEDWSPCNAGGLPTAESEVQAWRDYNAYVAESGRDPLNNFSVPRVHTHCRRWRVTVAPWLGENQFGLLFIAAERDSHHGVRYHIAQKGGKTPDTLPVAVREFLCLAQHNGHWILAGVSMDDLRHANETRMLKAGPGTWQRFLCTVEEQTPRGDAAIRRDLQRMAREATRPSPPRRHSETRWHNLLTGGAASGRMVVVK